MLKKVETAIELPQYYVVGFYVTLLIRGTIEIDLKDF